MSLSIDARFPAKLKFLFKPARYKVARGGRGSGKSWGFARAILLRCVQQPTRVLCTREIQKTIQQSVHQLLNDQIKAMGLVDAFDVLQTEIRAKNGSAIFFSGLSDITAASLKSFEGVDICWCEEAESITEKSWQILTPTIRKEGSEIWVTYNPQLESDPTHQRFVINPPPDCVSVVMNYIDNPYFPQTLELERCHARDTMREADYLNVWEGHCKPAVEGAIFYEQMSQAERAGRIKTVPHDGSLRTHIVFDLGFSDAMSIALVQKVSGEIRVIHYIEGTQRTLADYNAELRNLRLDDQPMNWGCCYLPHDGFHERHQTGKSDATVMQGFGWNVQQIPNMHVDSGINRAREAFPRVYFHQERAARLIECLKRYRWNINQKTGQAIAPLHDEFSHGGDCFRYLAIVEEQMSNDEYGGKLNYPKLNYA